MAEVRLSERASLQATALDSWWAENRTEAPALFAQEFANAIALLRVAPGAGARFQRSSVPGVRRVVLHRTRNLVFYVYDRSTESVQIIAVWGATRGTDPAF